MTTRSLSRVVAPLFAPSALWPMGEPGGVAYPMQHTPGLLRPFGASLAVAMPQAGKHSTDSTSPATKQPTQRSDDGKVYPDTLPDTGSDSQARVRRRCAPRRHSGSDLPRRSDR